ncbi:MAG: YihY/virulence factor BrkB family protein [Caldimonas sp.]
MAKLKLKDWWSLTKSAATSWIDDYAPSMGAALSYYTVFSLAPLLLIVVSVAGLVFGEEAVRGQLFSQLQGLMGQEAATAVQGLLASVSKPSKGIAGTVIGVAVLLFGATTVFGELQDALDRIWRAPARNKVGGIWGLLRTRLLSFGMILGLAFLLMVSLVFGAVLSALGSWWGPMFGGWEVLAQVVNVVVGFALTTGVFAMIYKLMPRVTVRWHDVWLGALVTSALFTIGKFLIGLYIGKTGVASGFGAAGSLVVVFVWVYYSAQIFLVGAEFTWVYARTFGSRKGDVADPAPAAVPAAAAVATAGAEAVPSRSGAAAAEVAVADGDTHGKPSARPGEVPQPSSWADIGTGVAVVLALRFVLPRLLRRL